MGLLTPFNGPSSIAIMKYQCKEERSHMSEIPNHETQALRRVFMVAIHPERPHYGEAL